MKRPKLFIIRKYVYAHSVTDAIRREKTYPVEDVWWDDMDKPNHQESKELGFKPRK